MTAKRRLIEDAYGELAIAGYEFDISPEEMQAAARKLDAMMGTWAAQGVRIAYAFGEDIDQDCGLSAVAVEAVYMGLACRLAASKGKQLPQGTTRTAKASFDSLMSYLAQQQVQEQQRPQGTPRGAGSKTWRTTSYPFMPKPNTDELQPGDDGGLNFTGA